jgi:RNA polymerase-binding protein DksA
MLNNRQLGELKVILDQRFYELREEIRQNLLDSDEEHFIDLAGQVHDLEDESVADLLVDLGLSIIDKHVEEIRDIDTALMRIAKGQYGVCVDCQAEIGIDRLHAYPTATRCQPCQASYERNHAGYRTATL